MVGLEIRVMVHKTISCIQFLIPLCMQRVFPQILLDLCDGTVLNTNFENTEVSFAMLLHSQCTFCVIGMFYSLDQGFIHQ